jgi:methylenetetrahydrofolate reductase (NADPH)
MARYMKNNVPGILVPDQIIQRMTDAGKPWANIPTAELTKENKRDRSNAWKEEGIKVCIDLINQVREIEGVAGVHIMAIEWENAVKPIAEGAGLLPRPELN